MNIGTSFSRHSTTDQKFGRNIFVVYQLQIRAKMAKWDNPSKWPKLTWRWVRTWPQLISVRSVELSRKLIGASILNTVNLTITFLTTRNSSILWLKGSTRELISNVVFQDFLEFRIPRNICKYPIGTWNASAKLEYIDEPLFEPKISKNPKVSRL